VASNELYYHEDISMQIQEHVKLSTAAALITAPLLIKDVWIPFTASLLIDVDHYLWHAVTYRTLSLRAAVRYFGQADPPQLPQARLFHHPLVLGGLLFLAVRLRSRMLGLILAGLLFHVSLDVLHVSQMNSLKYALREQANNKCRQCGRHDDALQLHTLYFSKNLLTRYNPEYFSVLCPHCHEQAHA
jgi:hypothetical protein